jgi:acyl-ACP thioesterase
VTGRRFGARRPIRLSDFDPQGRLRLDAVARYLQDIAADDVLDAGWSPDEHVWVVRRTELDIVRPFAGDATVDLETWCSGVAAAAASRRYTVRGDRGGLIEAESVWIHLDHDLQPLRLGERFLAVYGPAAEGRRTSAKLTLPGPPRDAGATAWPLRVADIDRLGHMNNAAYWVAVEERWGDRAAKPLRLALEYRRPIDLGEAVLLCAAGDRLWLVVDGEPRAAAAILGSR